MATATGTDIYLSHEWGGNSKTDHGKVSKINKALQQLGYITWLDNNNQQVIGNIRDQIEGRIENTKCFIAFITDRYHDRVVGGNGKDYCRLEFNYASSDNIKVPMIGIVLDTAMKSTSNWKGNVGLSLSSKLYVDMTGNIDDQTYLTKQLGILQQMLNDMAIKPSNLKYCEEEKGILL